VLPANAAPEAHRLFVRFVLTGSVQLKDLRRKGPLVAEDEAEALPEFSCCMVLPGTVVAVAQVELVAGGYLPPECSVAVPACTGQEHRLRQGRLCESAACHRVCLPFAASSKAGAESRGRLMSETVILARSGFPRSAARPGSTFGGTSSTSSAACTPRRR
jgi:hypothetical protein